jgi:flagellar protein FlbD
VIILTRLGGHQVAVNPDLIERAEPTPDTVLTMFDGHKIVVAESVDEVVAAVRSWRASVAAEAFGLTHAAGDGSGEEAVGVRASRDRSAHPAYGRVTSELVADDLAAHAALGSSLARVLRLPLSDKDGED